MESEYTNNMSPEMRSNLSSIVLHAIIRRKVTIAEFTSAINRVKSHYAGYAEDVPANEKVKELAEHIISIMDEPDLALQDVYKILNRVTYSIMNYSIVNNEGKGVE